MTNIVSTTRRRHHYKYNGSNYLKQFTSHLMIIWLILAIYKYTTLFCTINNTRVEGGRAEFVFMSKLFGFTYISATSPCHMNNLNMV